MSKPPSVLIVDDEPNIVLSLQFLMKKTGFEVRTAKDGEEAMAEISRAAPDLAARLTQVSEAADGLVAKQVRKQDGGSTSVSAISSNPAVRLVGHDVPPPQLHASGGDLALS